MKDKTRCLLVKAREIVRISEKCYKLKGWNGVETLVPASACRADGETTIWVACWFIQKHEGMQYQQKPVGWYSEKSGRVEIEATYRRHVPEQLAPEKSEPDADLLR